MTRVPVESSVLAAVLYLPEPSLLEVEFRSGAVYRYFAVPSQNYIDLLHAPSKGSYFNAKIRNCFSSQQITPPPDSAIKT